MTSRPHDALFKAAFESPAAAARLLFARLPPRLRAAVVWEEMKPETGSYVDSTLADRHNDLLFSTRLRTGADDRLYFVLEHQSTEDVIMPLRALSYETRIWDRSCREQPRQWLPPVIAVVVSHVPGGWSLSPQFGDMFEPRVLAISGLAPLVPRFSLLIDDLEHLSNADLKARSLGAFQQLALSLLRDGRDPRRLLDQFDTWLAAWREVERDPSRPDAFATLVSYMFRVVDPVYREVVRAKLEALGPHIQESIMTIADQIHEEGRKQGREEGRRQGRKEGRKRGRRDALAAAVRSLLVRKFHALAAADEARLRAAKVDALDRYLQRVLTADSLAEVLAD